MSVNSSSSSATDSLLHPNPSSNETYVSPYVYCLTSSPSFFILISYNITTIFLLLPLCIFILYHGLRQWRSTSSAATTSHSDRFTYHMVAMGLIRVFGCTFCFCGASTNNLNISTVGFFITAFNWYGEMYFHVLTCVERYLAVVHPITYLSLRKERGVRIRNISIGFVWLLSFVGMSLAVTEVTFIIIDILHLTLSFTVISFCSFSVVRVLIRSGPGDQVGRRERVDQSKLRAFYTIVTILGVLGLRLAWSLVWVVYATRGVSDCVIMTCDVWFSLPSTLVLPLLFIHRTGTLTCCKTIVK